MENNIIDKINITLKGEMDNNVFDKINITLRGEELKSLLSEWFTEFLEEIRKEMAAREKEEKYLTADETAEMLGVDKSTLWRWNKCGYLSNVKIGSKVRYRLTDVEELMKRR